MAISDLVSCCPWRLSAPRDFTLYERAVAQQAIADGMAKAIREGGGTTNPAFANESVQLLMGALLTGACVGWRQTSFGPAPAVPVGHFACLGYYYSKMAPTMTSRAAFLADVFAGKLCSPQGMVSCGRQPWSATGTRFDGFQPYEGAIQLTTYMAASTECELSRLRTRYVLTTGRQAIDMLQQLQAGASQLGVQVPVPAALASLIAAAQGAPALFMDREFFIGFQLRTNPNPQRLAQLTATLMAGFNVSVGAGGALVINPGPVTPEKMKASADLVMELFEEIGALWAPGQGFSLMPFLSGQLDPTKLIGMASALGIDPNAILTMLGSLPPQWQTAISQQLPQLASQFGGLVTQFQQMWGAPAPLQGLGATVVHSRLLSTPGAQLLADPAPPLPAGTAVVSVPVGDDAFGQTLKTVAVIAAVAGVSLLGWMFYQDVSYKPYATPNRRRGKKASRRRR